MSLSSGTRIGPYEIISPVGAGGMGEVYRARDSKLGRSVAIKVLPSLVASNRETLDRFEREAKLLASLNHPNIAAIYGFEDSDKPALVMEFVEGPTLADRILAGPILLESALPIGKQICDALEYAHEHGVIHRDVKPANIKVTADGAVKLLDFGLAKALEDTVVTSDISSSPTFTNLATQAGLILGTAAYMSPEQAKGRRVDRRADIWAFGCVLFEMLTAKKAFGGETVTDTLAEIIKVEPDWTLLPANTPRTIRYLIERCVKKDAKQRLQAIGEARITIEEVLAGKDSSVDEAATKPTARENRSIAGWIGGFVAGALVVAAVSWWTARSASAPAAMHFSAVTSFAGVQAQPALSPDGRSVAFVSNRDGHYNIYVGLVRGGELVQITHGDALKLRPNWSPDGSTLAYAQLNDSGLTDIWEVSALGGTPRMVVVDANDAAWTPDGRSLVYESADGMVWTCGVAGENPHLLVHMDPPQTATELRVSPDGKMVSMAVRLPGPYGELGVADIGTGKLRLLTQDQALVLSPAWTPDSHFIYFSSSRGGTLNIWKVGADGKGLRQVTAGEGDDAELDVSIDGKRLVFAALRSNIGLAEWDPQAQPGEASVQVVANDPARNEFGPAYSPDGKRIAFFTNLKGTENESISVADANGGNAVQLVRDSRINLLPHWLPAGNRIAYSSWDNEGSGEGRVVAVSGGAPQTVLQFEGFGVGDVCKDGRMIYVQTNGEAHAFDPRTGKDLILGRVPNNTLGTRWSPDCAAVAYLLPGQRIDDPDGGVWVTDFKTAPKQVFRGWAPWFAVAHDEIFVLKGKDDLNGELWKVKWDGSGLTRIPGTVPLLYDLLYYHSLPGNQFDVSPDGRHVVLQTQQVLQENIGIIDNLQ